MMRTTLKNNTESSSSDKQRLFNETNNDLVLEEVRPESPILPNETNNDLVLEEARLYRQRAWEALNGRDECPTDASPERVTYSVINETQTLIEIEIEESKEEIQAEIININQQIIENSERVQDIIHRRTWIDIINNITLIPTERLLLGVGAVAAFSIASYTTYRIVSRMGIAATAPKKEQLTFLGKLIKLIIKNKIK